MLRRMMATLIELAVTPGSSPETEAHLEPVEGCPEVPGATPTVGSAAEGDAALSGWSVSDCSSADCSFADPPPELPSMLGVTPPAGRPVATFVLPASLDARFHARTAATVAAPTAAR